MAERSITEALIQNALENPTKVSYDNHGRILVKKVYKKETTNRLLLIAGEFFNGILRIITVIDTSKVKKYL